jgi:hypothetical protein
MPGNDLLSQGVAPQLPSALRSLTSVFGMGTGVSFSPLSPDIFNYTNFFSLFNFFLHPQSQIAVRQAHPLTLRLSPRSIRIRQLHTSPCFHPGPIYLVFFKGSYSFRVAPKGWEISS